MKRIILLLITIALCAIMASCQSTYTFYQIYEAEPLQQDNMSTTEDGCLKFENGQCRMIYYFWANKGSADVAFYNKTNEIIYIDLTKSFFIRNGKAYDLYLEREWSNSSSSGLVQSSSNTYLSSLGFAASANVDYAPGRIFSSLGDGNVGTVSANASKTAGKTYGTSVVSSLTSSESIKEKPIMAIPPHCTKRISTSTIAQKAYYSCNLQSCPSDSSRVTFSPENSPLQFANYITYTVGDSKDAISIENKFYISAITNFAEPEAIDFKKREDVCENLKYITDYQSTTDVGAPLYDRYIRSGICKFEKSFYNYYEVKTSKRLYSSTVWFRYNPWYDAYTK